ncbi:MAG TPA: hypothetical protein VFW40_01580, partial [Capsulimonadaceae bacterium]|nr:hypothetical protein [Capsulimonadaceae bacterium]
PIRIAQRLPRTASDARLSSLSSYFSYTFNVYDQDTYQTYPGSTTTVLEDGGPLHVSGQVWSITGSTLVVTPGGMDTSGKVVVTVSGTVPNFPGNGTSVDTWTCTDTGIPPVQDTNSAFCKVQVYISGSSGGGN